MSTDRESRELRERLADLDRRLRAVEDVGGMPTRGHYLAAKLRDAGAFPGSAGVYFEATRQRVLGVEAEGERPLLFADASVVYPIVTGADAPSVGDIVLCTHAPHRWVAGPPGTAATNTNFSGAVKSSCFNLQVAVAVVITRDSDSAVLWSGTSSEVFGYSGAIALAADEAVTVTATPPYPRLVAGTYSFTMLAGSSNTIPDITLARGAGYYCAENCRYPVGGTLTYLHRASGATGTLTRAGPGSNWVGTAPSPDGTSTTTVTYTGVALVGGNGPPAGGGFGSSHSGVATCFDGTNTFKVTYVTSPVSLGGGFHPGQLIDISEP